MITKEAIIKKLDSIHEHKMAKEILVPTLKAMDLKGVKYTGGNSEEGIDIEYYEFTKPENHKSYVGIQCKKGDITYGSGGGKNTVKEVKNQAEEAFEKEIFDTDDKTKYFISRFVVATTGEINEPARKYIGRARQYGKDRRIDYWTGDRLAEYIQQNWIEGFTEYFKDEIASDVDPVEECIVNEEYLEENYYELIAKCSKIRNTTSVLEWEILKTITLGHGDISIGDLCYELECQESYMENDIRHLLSFEYITAEDNTLSLDGRAEVLKELYEYFEEELFEAEEEETKAEFYFNKLVK